MGMHISGSLGGIQLEKLSAILIEDNFLTYKYLSVSTRQREFLLRSYSCDSRND
jgi:hypothetical protein